MVNAISDAPKLDTAVITSTALLSVEWNRTLCLPTLAFHLNGGNSVIH